MMMATDKITMQDDFLRRLVINGEEATIEEMQKSLGENRRNIHSISQHLRRRDLIIKTSKKTYVNGKIVWEIKYKVNIKKRLRIRDILHYKFGAIK